MREPDGMHKGKPMMGISVLRQQVPIVFRETRIGIKKQQGNSCRGHGAEAATLAQKSSIA